MLSLIGYPRALKIGGGGFQFKTLFKFEQLVPSKISDGRSYVEVTSSILTLLVQK